MGTLLLDLCVLPLGEPWKKGKMIHMCVWHVCACMLRHEPCIRLRKHKHNENNMNTQQVCDSLRVPANLFQHLFSMDMLYTQQVSTGLRVPVSLFRHVFNMNMFYAQQVTPAITPTADLFSVQESPEPGCCPHLESMTWECVGLWALGKNNHVIKINEWFQPIVDFVFPQDLWSQLCGSTMWGLENLWMHKKYVKHICFFCGCTMLQLRKLWIHNVGVQNFVDPQNLWDNLFGCNVLTQPKQDHVRGTLAKFFPDMFQKT